MLRAVRGLCEVFMPASVCSEWGAGVGWVWVAAAVRLAESAAGRVEKMRV